MVYRCPKCSAEAIDNKPFDGCSLMKENISVEEVCVSVNKESCDDCKHYIRSGESGTFIQPVEAWKDELGNPVYIQVHQCLNCGCVFGYSE